MRDLKEDKIDFGFCSIGEKEDPDIKMITLMEYPIKLVVNQKDVLGKMKQLHPEDLMSKPGISYTEGSAMDREINEFFKEQDYTGYTLPYFVRRDSEFCSLWIGLGIYRTEWDTDEERFKNP